MDLAFTTIAKGDSEFIRRVAAPVAESIEAVLFDQGFEQAHAWREEEMLLLDQRPRAEAGLVVGLVGVLLFVAKDFIKKILDDVYEVKVGPLLRRKLKAAALSGEKSNKALLFGVWLADARVLVVVLDSGKRMEDLVSSVDRIPAVLSKGLASAIASESTKEVHVYRVEEGSVDSAVRIYKDLMTALMEEGCA